MCIRDRYMGKFAMKTNETQLKRYYQKVVIWSDQHTQIAEKNGLFKYLPKITLLRLTIKLSETLGSYFVQFYAFIFDFLLDYMNEFVQQFSQPRKLGKKRQHSEADEILENYVQLHMLTLQAFRLCFLNDKDEFIDTLKFDKMNEVFVNQLDAVYLPNEMEYISYVKKTYIPCVLSLFDLIKDDYKWKSLNYNIIMKTRSDSVHVKIGALTVVSEVIEHLKERFVVLINDIVPFISETLEDQNIEVEKLSKSIVIRLEQITGENIKEYMRMQYSFRVAVACCSSCEHRMCCILR
eukprot:TRINITY_DN957_c0_g1_i11.p1 TRINITY_DN957_c0_g1~~TRINITY_DN957_c0_g1_i11.p1  ORF type:complete len:294 (+),score=91.96 TRINITY_DN957_c0_g1_i11:65-946(+)